MTTSFCRIYVDLYCYYCTCAAVMLGLVAAIPAHGAQPLPPSIEVADAQAQSEKEMKPYAEVIEHTENTIRMLPIPGGTFTMGSPESETGRKEDEGPQRQVKIDPFWMAECEITWEAYEVWMFDLDIQRREFKGTSVNERDTAADEFQLSQPTEPYMNMDFGMGKRNCPAICMTQLAARTFCDWLSAKTGRYYRLPTEAEWEYACRARSKTAYSFGDSQDDLADYGWFFDNSEDERYHKVKQKKPNAWGLYDMHGNVSEWVLDQYQAEAYKANSGGVIENPLVIPTTEYPRVARGGSYLDDADMLRSANRIASAPEWKKQDPQVPKSIWYFTDATFLGFRIVRPLKTPDAAEIDAKWGKSEPVEDRKEGR